MKKGETIYTQAELETLSRLYLTTPLREISRIMGKSFGSLQWQRHRLGLSKPLSSYKPQHILALTQTELAYIAGLIDGEGTVSIRKLGGKWKPCIRIANTQLALIDWLSKTMAGPSIYVEHRNYRGGLAYIFHIQGLGHLPFYDEVAYYLVLKQELMLLMIEFCKLRLSQSHNEPWTARQAEIVSAIRAINMSRYSKSNAAM